MLITDNVSMFDMTCITAQHCLPPTNYTINYYPMLHCNSVVYNLKRLRRLVQRHAEGFTLKVKAKFYRMSSSNPTCDICKLTKEVLRQDYKRS